MDVLLMDCETEGAIIDADDLPIACESDAAKVVRLETANEHLRRLVVLQGEFIEYLKEQHSFRCAHIAAASEVIAANAERKVCLCRWELGGSD